MNGFEFDQNDEKSSFNESVFPKESETSRKIKLTCYNSKMSLKNTTGENYQGKKKDEINIQHSPIKCIKKPSKDLGEGLSNKPNYLSSKKTNNILVDSPPQNFNKRIKENSNIIFPPPVEKSIHGPLIIQTISLDANLLPKKRTNPSEETQIFSYQKIENDSPSFELKSPGCQSTDSIETESDKINRKDEPECETFGQIITNKDETILKEELEKIELAKEYDILA
jgi:hypothetical protein